MKMKTIMVAGAGQMGAGIAQTAAEAGFAVNLYDWEPETVTKGLHRIKTNLEKEQAKDGSHSRRQMPFSAVFPRQSLQKREMLILSLKPLPKTKSKSGIV